MSIERIEAIERECKELRKEYQPKAWPQEGDEGWVFFVAGVERAYYCPSFTYPAGFHRTKAEAERARDAIKLLATDLPLASALFKLHKAAFTPDRKSGVWYTLDIGDMTFYYASKSQHDAALASLTDEEKKAVGL